MVRKVMSVCIALAVALCVAAPASAATTTPYDGTISSTLADYFSDILTKVSPLKNYVLMRSGQYQYVLYVGDFDWNGTSFSTASADVYTIATNTNYNSTYSLNVSTISDLTILPGDRIVYSDLGPFPGLRDPIEIWGFFLLVAVFIMLLVMMIRPIFWR